MKLVLAIALFLAVAISYPLLSFSQVVDDATPPPELPSEIFDYGKTGPVGIVDEYKFDEGFYEKIQELMSAEPQEGDYGVYDGVRYYDVIMVVSRDDGDNRNGDETAQENKDSVVRLLDLIGARNIVSAESLSFVTASVPIAKVPGFSLNDEVYALGDGEIPVSPSVDTARRTIHATPTDILTAVGSTPDGRGVVVAVVDTGINSVYLNDKVSERIYCPEGTCSIQNGLLVGKTTINVIPDLLEVNSTNTIHGTRVAQVLAASGLSEHNGIAQGVTLLDAWYGNGKRSYAHGNLLTSVAHSLDWSLSRGADVVNLSLGFDSCRTTRINAFYLIVNEAVDKGMVSVNAAGNRGDGYETIDNPSCTYNIIAVGGINDRSLPITMFDYSSRGPISSDKPRLAPHVVAPATHLQTLDTTTGFATSPTNGTSYATPQVSATAALMLQVEPELTPAEVKAGILLGANWTGPVPCTSVQYEMNNATDNCSHSRQPSNMTEANDHASIGILNNVGFGILDTANTLRYVKTLTSYVISDHLDTTTTSKQYRFPVSDTSEPVKVILTWMAHPHGGILEQAARDTPSPIADLGFTITQPNGNMIRADSEHQNTEFAVFQPSQRGSYTVTVSGDGLNTINKPLQAFTLASTNTISEITSSSNQAPTAQSRTITISPGMEVPVLLSSTDANGDAVSFHVSRDPTKGTVTVDELLTKTLSRVLYTADSDFAGTDTFQVIPHDGKTQGRAATITLRAESLPPGSTLVPINSSRVTDFDTFQPGTVNYEGYTMQFEGKSYPVSSLYLGSVNMEGVDAQIITTDGQRYTIAVPSSDDRMIDISPPIMIRSLTLTADGIEEEAIINTDLQQVGPDIRMYAGYVQHDCTAGASGQSDFCPATSTYRSTVQPRAAIPDNTDTQALSSVINVPVDGTLSSLSVSVDITHTWIGDIRVYLTSPDGTRIVLHNQGGGSTDNIQMTYTDFEDLVDSQIRGDWTLSVGDYIQGFAGTLNEWGLEVSYTPQSPVLPEPASGPATIFSEDFESGLSKWTETGEGDWRITRSNSHSVPTAPDHDSDNLVLHSDNCDSSCTVTIRNSLDLTGYSAATLSFIRFVDFGLDSGEYLRVQLYDGNRWNTIFDWTHGSGDDNRWNAESFDLAPYLSASNFEIRFVTRQSSSSEDVQIDNVVITGTMGSAPTNPPPTNPPPTNPPPQPPTPPTSQYTVYLADTDDREVLAFAKDGTYQGVFIQSRAGGLGKVWDVAFGPDGHLYAADGTYSKIRKYNGATGAPISGSSGWAATAGFPYGLEWNGNTLYVGTSRGVERFSASGSALGYFGDATRNPSTFGAVGLLNVYDLAFCADNRMYVADRSNDAIYYYSSSTGKYQGQISGSSPDTEEAGGIECGPAMSSFGNSLYQSGDDRGRVNEINPSNFALIREITSLIDEPYGMAVDGASMLYVANKDDDNIIKIFAGAPSVFASGPRMDDPRGLTIGPVYSSASGSAESLADTSNDGPEFAVSYGGINVTRSIDLAVDSTASLTVRATDPDGDDITLGIIPDMLPESAISLTNDGNNAATITLDTAGLEGSYVFWVEASDGTESEREPYTIIIS